MGLLLVTFVAAKARFELGVQDGDSAFTMRRRDVKVPVTLGVMSRCPDALLCEAVFDKVVAQVGDKMELSLSFIGTCVSN